MRFICRDRMKKMSLISPIPRVSRKLAITTLGIILTIIIIDLITTRRILPYNNSTEDILFVTTIIIISIGSFILLAYAKHVIKEIYSRSFFIKTIFISTVPDNSYNIGYSVGHAFFRSFEL